MGYRPLDENIEHGVLHRFTADGHDVEHVDSVPRVRKGTSDETIARYSLDADRTIVTHDADFVDGIPSNRYRVVLFFADDTVSATEIVVVVDRMSGFHPHEEVTGLQKTGREWL